MLTAPHAKQVLHIPRVDFVHFGHVHLQHRRLHFERHNASKMKFSQTQGEREVLFWGFLLGRGPIASEPASRRGTFPEYVGKIYGEKFAIAG